MPAPHPLAASRDAADDAAAATAAARAGTQTLCVAPLRALLRFESSALWPAELAPLRATKRAFLLRIAQLLQRADARPAQRARGGPLRRRA